MLWYSILCVESVHNTLSKREIDKRGLIECKQILAFLYCYGNYSLFFNKEFEKDSESNYHLLILYFICIHFLLNQNIRSFYYNWLKRISPVIKHVSRNNTYLKKVELIGFEHIKIQRTCVIRVIQKSIISQFVFCLKHSHHLIWKVHA